MMWVIPLSSYALHMYLYPDTTHRERLIPNKLDGPLDATYSRALQDTVQYVTSKGGYAVLDPHNFGIKPSFSRRDKTVRVLC